MSTPTHIIVGAVLAKLGIGHGIVPDVPHLIYPLSIAFANLPDIDILYIRHPKNHRLSGSHYPIIWAMLLVIAYLAIDITGDMELLGYFTIAASGLLSHFILDTFGMGDGIRWFAPFSKVMIRFLPCSPYIPDDIREFIKMYLKHPIMILEGLIWITGFYFLIEG